MPRRSVAMMLAFAALTATSCDDPTPTGPESKNLTLTAPVPIALPLHAVGDTEFKVTASDRSISDFFGVSVSVREDVAIVGSPRDDDGGLDSGSAYVFRRVGGAWVEEAKLTASDAAEFDRFGQSVAIDGEVAVVGALFHDDGGVRSGSAYIFRRSGGVWSEEAKLVASDRAAFDQFGGSVGISGDAAIIGALGDDDAGTISGSAYIFRRSGGVWSEEAKLTASDAAAGDQFGNSVAVEGDAVLVASFTDDGGAGSAYVFRSMGGAWSEEAKLTAADGAGADFFGAGVGISSDLVNIGAPGDDDMGSFSGSAYVFRRVDGVWSQEEKLTASDGAGNDQFGRAVAIDGGVVLVGVAGADPGGLGEAGAAYFYALTPPVIEFASFDVERAQIQGQGRADKFEVSGTFALGDDSDGFDFAADEVTVTFGEFTQTLPAGSFARDDDDEGWTFETEGSGLSNVDIRDDGRFRVKTRKVDLTWVDFGVPVPFDLQIGEDLGSLEIPFDNKGRFRAR